MFYTYLRGLVVFILWSINGNAHYHNTDKIPNQDENYIWLPLTALGGIQFTWLLRPSQNSLSLWPKRLFTNRIFWLVDPYVWGLSY